MGHSRPLFRFKQFTDNNLDSNRIRTRIARLEGEQADHLTTTTARRFLTSLCIQIKMN